MNLIDYIAKESKKNALNQELVAELKKISNDDYEFTHGVLQLAYNDEDRATLLEYIKKGEDVNYSQIILNALWLCEQREEKEGTDN